MRGIVQLSIRTVFAFVVAGGGVVFGQDRFASESFGYEAGNLNGLGVDTLGWAGPWQSWTGSIEVMDGNLEPDAQGRYAEMTPDDGPDISYLRDLKEAWPDSGVPYWVGFMFQRVDRRPINKWGGLSLYNGDNEVLFLGSPWEKSAVGIDVKDHIQIASDVSDTLLSWVVARLDMNGTEELDSVFFWVNPDPSAEPDRSTAAGAGTFHGTEGFNRIRIGTSGYLVAIDMIRIGTSFEAIRPAVVGIHRRPGPATTPALHLYRKRPNSPHHSVRFRYVLDRAGDISLSILDGAGRTVAVPASGWVERGSYVAEWKTEGRTGGVYVLTLRAGGAVISRKVLLPN